MPHDTPLLKRAYNLGLKTVANFEGLSLETIAYYEKHLNEIPAALARGFIVPPKFALLADLGIITVPDDYNHRTALATFLKKNRKKFHSVNDDINDVNFPNPSRSLNPGDKLRVRAFKQIVEGTTTPDERMEFLRSQKAVFTGAQGACLVFEQKHDQLPWDYWYVSFDEPDRLYESADGDRQVLRLLASLGVGFYLVLGHLKGVWDTSNALLCFTEVSDDLIAMGPLHNAVA